MKITVPLEDKHVQKGIFFRDKNILEQGFLENKPVCAYSSIGSSPEFFLAIME